MKRFLNMLLVLLITSAVFAQQDAVKFLGIPVDGTVSEMMAKLKAKGFRDANFGIANQLEGRFNDADVFVIPMENNSKVYRIAVGDKNSCDETNIRIRFNSLCSQFLNNQKYFHPEEDSTYFISDTEDISYEMTVHHKRYQAAFYQNNTDTTYMQRCLIEAALSKYPKEQVPNLSNKQWEDLLPLSVERQMRDLQQRVVWFMIDRNPYGLYTIQMFYDNANNMSNGDDL